MINALFMMLFVTVLYIEYGVKKEQREQIRKVALKAKKMRIVKDVNAKSNFYSKKTAWKYFLLFILE